MIGGVTSEKHDAHIRFAAVVERISINLPAGNVALFDEHGAKGAA
jgi:hypothetical protein